MYMHDPTGLVHLQAHAVIDLVVCQCNVILVDSVPIAEQHQRHHLEDKLVAAHHFFSWIFEAFVPVCAAMSFFRSPTVSSGLHLTRTVRKISQASATGGDK